MENTTIATWIKQEADAFWNFNDFIAERMETAIVQSIVEKMRLDLLTMKSTKLEMPWGTFSAEVKTVGESTNITPSWEPSKNFLKMLNDDTTANYDRRQDVFDKEFLRLFKDYVCWGEFDPDAPKNANHVPKAKGTKLEDDDCEYFLNGYCQVLATIARDHQRSGKVYRLAVLSDEKPHGTYEFEYAEDGTITVKFVPDKSFKQHLKKDDAEDESVVAASAAYMQTDYWDY